MYQILHIPTNQLLEVTDLKDSYYHTPTVALFKSKAQAGKAIEKYRLGCISSDPKQRYKHFYQLYLLSFDYVSPGVYYIDGVQYIRLATNFIITNALFVLKSTHCSLSIKQREKRFQKEPSFSHKEEFLIMEVI